MKDPITNNKIENWKKGFLSEDLKTVQRSADNLVEIGGDSVVKYLIGLLEIEHVKKRNIVALALRDLKENKAIEPLLKSIFKPENKNNNGTMVYALQELNCKDKLVDIFKILFFQGYESKLLAYNILDEQTFEFSKDDLNEIQRMWKEYNRNTDKDEETIKIVKDAYDGYIEYLNEKNKPSS